MNDKTVNVINTLLQTNETGQNYFITISTYLADLVIANEITLDEFRAIDIKNSIDLKKIVFKA